MSDTLFTDATASVAGTLVIASWLNDVDKNTYNVLSSIAGTNAITAVGPLPFTSYTTGAKMWFTPQNTNTGATTLNIGGLGAKAVTKYGATALVAGDLLAGDAAYIFYDGTQWQLVNPRNADVSTATGILPIANGGTASTTANTAFNTLSAGITLSFRNKLINATGTINQRAYVSGTATSGANQYTLDRWRVVTSGQNLTFSTTGIVTTMTAPAGGLEQVIEGNNIEGGIYTLSWTGTATATYNGTSITNGSQTTSLTAGSNVTIRFTSGTVSLPQFEKATVTTQFEYRHMGIELMLASRYYHKKTSTTQAAIATGLSFSTTHAAFTIHMPVEMRTVPTVTSSTLRPTDGGGVSIASTASSFVYFSGTSILADITVAAGLTAGQASILYAGNGSGGNIAFDAEI